MAMGRHTFLLILFYFTFIHFFRWGCLGGDCCYDMPGWTTAAFDLKLYLVGGEMSAEAG